MMTSLIACLVLCVVVCYAVVRIGEWVNGE